MFDSQTDGCGPGPAERLARCVSSLSAVQAQALADLAEALAVDARCRTAGELTDAVRGLDRVQALVDDVTVRVWSAWEDTNAHADDGYAAPGPWLAANLDVRRGRAHFQIGLARKLRNGFPLVGEAAAAGRLGRAKVELLVKARTPEVAELFDREEADLVTDVQARTVEAAEAYLASWRLAAFERLGRNLPDSDPGDHREPSHLQFSPLLEGRALVRGELDAVDAATVIQAVNDRIDQWYTAGLLAGDTRSRQELQAAALVELVTDGTAATNRGKGARPLVIALIDADTLSARAAEAYLDWLTHRGAGGDASGAATTGPDGTPGPTGTPGHVTAGRPARASRRGDPPRPPSPRPGQPPPGLPSARPPAPASGASGSASGGAVPSPGDPPAEPPDTQWPRRTGHGSGGPPTNPPPTDETSAARSNREGPTTVPVPDPTDGSDRDDGHNGDHADHGHDGPTGAHADVLQRIEDHLAALRHFAASSPQVHGRVRMPFRSELVGAGPVHPSLIAQLLCTGGLTPIVHRGHTEILQVGRTTRLATAAQRKALIVRSGGTCEWPGCTIPHSWCDAHHLHHWEHGGPTDLDNLALVCNHHHTRFHQAGFTAVITSAGLEVHRPDGTQLVPPHSTRAA